MNLSESSHIPYDQLMIFTFTVTAEEAGQRAAELLKKHFACSSTMLKQIRLYGQLMINGIPSRMKTNVQAGDLIEAYPPSQQQEKFWELPTDGSVLYADPWLLAVNKEAGWTVHASLNPHTPNLIAKLSAQPLHPVNRLDRDTSGICLIANNAHCHQLLSHQNMHKTYLALCHGRFDLATGQLDFPIARDPSSIILRQIDPAGKASITQYRSLRYWPQADVSLLECQLLSGRTHQIRVHCLAAGHPLLGDPFYGFSVMKTGIDDPHIVSPTYLEEARRSLAAQSAPYWAERIERQALHAHRLTLTCPYDREKRQIIADPPADFLRLLQALDAQA